LPSEFSQRSNKEILDYLRELLREPKTEVFRMKVMLVGPGEAGKTTLLNHLLKGEFVPSEGMTDGVSMRTWSPQLPLFPSPSPSQDEMRDQSSSNSSEPKIQLSMWDFGGQEIYLNTHPILFTDKTLYLIVWNPRSRTTVATLEDYILNIRSRDRLAPILFVTTHRAEVHDREVRRVLIDLDKYVSIGHLSIDSVTGEGMKELKERIIQLVTIDYSHYSRALIPTWYLGVESMIRERSKSQFSMTRDELLAVCSCATTAFMTTPPSTTLLHRLDALLFLFHHWGVVFVLPDPNLPNGQDFFSCGDIILDPQRLADVLRAVVSSHRSTSQANRDLLDSGVLNHALTPLIWPNYDPRLCTQFLALLHSSELAYEIYDSIGLSTHQSLVPALLPPSRRLTEREIREGIREGTSPETVAADICPLLQQGSVRVSLDCLLPNFFPKLIVRLRHLSSASQIARTSFTIRIPLWDERKQEVLISIACVVEEKESNSLTVYPAGRSLDATAICLRTIDSLMLRSFPGMKVEEILLTTPGKIFCREEISGKDFVELRDGFQLSLRFLAPMLTPVKGTTERGTPALLAPEIAVEQSTSPPLPEQLSESDAQTLSKLEEKLAQFQRTGDICDRLSLLRTLLDATSLFRRVGFEFDAEPKVLWLAAAGVAGEDSPSPPVRLYAVSPSVSPCLPWEIVWETEVILSSPASSEGNPPSLSEFYLASLTCLFFGQLPPLPPSRKWVGVVPCQVEDVEVIVRGMETKYFAQERDIFGEPVLYSKDLLTRQRAREGVGEVQQLRDIVRGELEDALGDLALLIRHQQVGA
jgi:GTPase SAR1 family protein